MCVADRRITCLYIGKMAESQMRTLRGQGLHDRVVVAKADGDERKGRVSWGKQS